MIASIYLKKAFTLIFFICAFSDASYAQAGKCVFKDTMLFFNFGTESNPTQFILSSLKNYKEAKSSCPDDGFYAYISQTSNCFMGDWLNLPEDHTAADDKGRMMLVNANERAGDFFIVNMQGFKPSTTYELSVWLINVCRINSGCPPLPPNLLLTIQSASGKKIADFKTGALSQNENPVWRRYSGIFTTPPDVTILTLKMSNTTNGGCGNDFAMDDIGFKECYLPTPTSISMPPTIPEKKKVVTIHAPDLPKKETGTKPLKKNTKAVEFLPVREYPTLSNQDFSPTPAPKVYLLPLLTRKNPVVKQIDTDDADILIELYDNGEIDGDTVSIYHNNELIVSHRGLSEKPISFSIKVDSSNPMHEIVMVADNLGSIPPNTSLMIVTIGKKRYEVFISSSEQKNAKVIIQKKE